ncbi:MAG: hypothetical protein ACKO32_11460 [Planctomycetia bacterium]
MFSPLDPLFQRYVAAEAAGQQGCVLWIEGPGGRLKCEAEHLELSRAGARVVYLPELAPERAFALARAWCEEARAAGGTCHIGLALTQAEPLLLETLMEVAREGAAVARHQGLTAVAHSELYDLVQRRLQRQFPHARLPARGQARRSPDGTRAEPASAAAVHSASDPRIAQLERRLEKLLAELREKDAELASLRAERDAGGTGLPSLLAVRERELDARRQALFEVIFEENLSLQAHLRRAN